MLEPPDKFMLHPALQLSQVSFTSSIYKDHGFSPQMVQWKAIRDILQVRIYSKVSLCGTVSYSVMICSGIPPSI